MIWTNFMRGSFERGCAGIIIGSGRVRCHPPIAIPRGPPDVRAAGPGRTPPSLGHAPQFGRLDPCQTPSVGRENAIFTIDESHAGPRAVVGRAPRRSAPSVT